MDTKITVTTKCPACGACFRVNDQQLSAAQSRVRCGTCLTAFNALDNLVEFQKPEPIVVPTPVVVPELTIEVAKPQPLFTEEELQPRKKCSRMYFIIELLLLVPLLTVAFILWEQRATWQNNEAWVPIYDWVCTRVDCTSTDAAAP